MCRVLLSSWCPSNTYTTESNAASNTSGIAGPVRTKTPVEKLNDDTIPLPEGYSSITVPSVASNLRKSCHSVSGVGSVLGTTEPVLLISTI